MSWSANSRLAEVIRERVANVVLFELQDPRIRLVTVTRVRLAKDLSTCQVYWSVLGSAADRSRTEHALRDATGFVQREVARVLRTRVTPRLQFRFDEAVEGGLRMSGLLKQLEEERGDGGDESAGEGDAEPTEDGDPQDAAGPEESEADPRPD